MYKCYKNVFFLVVLFFVSSIYITHLEAQTNKNMISSNESRIELIKDIRPGGLGSNPHKIIDVNGIAYFIASETGNYGLWKSDGTRAGTQFVIDLDDPDIDFNYEEFTVFKDQLFFRAADTQIGLGSELWATNGTAEGTRLIRDIYVGSGSGFPSYLAVKDSLLLFLASSEDLVAGGIETELWRSDGTTAGTYMVKDIWPGPYHNNGGPGINGYTSSAVVNGVYYFAALGPNETAGENTIGGLETWRSDGTEAGTNIVVDLTPTYDVVYGAAWSYPNSLTNFRNQLVFSAYSTNAGNELFKSDGTAGGTVLVKDICGDNGTPCCGNNNGSFPGDFIVVDSLLYFFACDGVHGRELWKTDGTEEGTNMVIDLTEGEESTTITEQTAFDGILYFVYDDGDDKHGNELWRTDGTAEGTFLVKDIATGVDVFERANNSNPGYLTVVNNLMYFSAWTQDYGRELWQTDGTTDGTVMVQDMHTAVGFGSNPQDLTNVNGQLFFTADSYEFDSEFPYTGYELWKVNSVPTGVESNSISLDFKLFQNYPNPFNPETIIKYQVTNNGYVELSVFNLLGEKVRVVLNEIQPAGTYEVRWNGTDNNNNPLSSGIYLYRLTSGAFNYTKKMILLR